MRRSFLWVVVALASLAGCPESSVICARNSDCQAGNYCSGGSCTSDCTPATAVTDCASGESCSSFGMCVAPPDAGTRDAGPPRSDGGADSPDLRPDCVIAGGIDADGDGYCATGPEVDCNETEAAVSPGADEVCTDSMAGTPVDENCDGVLDEGCAYAFGVPHWLSDLAMSNITQWFPRLSADGLTIYFGGWDWSATGGARFVPHFATRASLDVRFGTPSIVPGTWTVGSHVAVFTPRADGLEGFIQVDFADGHREIHSVTRATTSAPFAPPTPAIASTGSWLHPALSADGLELYFTGVAPSPAGIYRAVRSSIGAAFSAPERLDIPSVPGTADAVDSPWPMEDGSILFAGRAGSVQRLFHAARGPGGTYLAPVELEEISDGGDGFIGGPFYSPATRELFFTSGRSWSPGGQWGDGTRQGGIWRAEVCRDGACPERRVECATGIRSPDRLHCYTGGTGPQPYGNAVGACTAPTGPRSDHLVSIHSEAERAFVWARFGSPSALAGSLWLGASDESAEGTWRWESGEPFVFAAWGPGDPDGGTTQNGLVSWWGFDGLFASQSTAVSHQYVCETEMWPTW